MLTILNFHQFLELFSNCEIKSVKSICFLIVTARFCVILSLLPVLLSASMTFESTARTRVGAGDPILLPKPICDPCEFATIVTLVRLR